MAERDPTDVERMAKRHYEAAQGEVQLPSIPWDHLTQEKRKRMAVVMLASVRELRDLLHGAGVHSGASAVANVIIAHERLCREGHNERSL